MGPGSCQNRRSGQVSQYPSHQGQTRWVISCPRRVIVRRSLSARLFRRGIGMHGRAWSVVRIAPEPGATLAPSRRDAKLGQKPLRQHHIDNNKCDDQNPGWHVSITLRSPVLIQASPASTSPDTSW